MNVEINDKEIDVLREVASIGSGNAATALSQMINGSVRIRIPEVDLVPIESIPQRIGGSDMTTAGIFLFVTGDINGSALLLFEEKTAFLIANELIGQTTFSDLLDEEKESALKELGNIVVGNYLNAMSDFLGCKIFPSVPHITVDTSGSMLNFALNYYAQSMDNVLFAHTIIEIGDKNLDGTILLLFDNNSIDIILQKTKEKIEK